MFTIFFRTILIYIILIIVLRLMGKRQIGEMQPFELVITLVIAELACIPMSDVAIPLFYGVIPIITLLMLHRIVTLLVRYNMKARALFSGKATVVITPDGIDYENLNKLNMTVSDLLESIRNAGYFSFDDVVYGIYETNGQFSALEKPKTPQEEMQEPTLPLLLISGGKILKEHLTLANIDKDWIDEKLQQEQIKSIKDVVVMTLDNEGKIYLQENGKSFKNIETDYQGGYNW